MAPLAASAADRPPMAVACTVTLSLVSHTNAGKTTLARTLLGRDIGEVRDAPHVTEFASVHELIATPEGDRLLLADTPGFGDSARLLRRLQGGGPAGGWLHGSAQALRWLLSAVWDRWRDRAFWSSQQALRHVQAHSDVVLYLVNAAESPETAGYVAPEMDLLAWLGRPVLVLLNQLGAPRTAAEEAHDVQAWRSHLARWPLVQGVLPLDAFARCWVHERTLLASVQAVLPGAGTGQAGPAHGAGDAGNAGDPGNAGSKVGHKAQAMARLGAAWAAQRLATFDAAMAVLAHSLALCAAARATVAEPAGIAGRLRGIVATLTRRDEAATAGVAQATPAAAAQRQLAATLAGAARDSTARLLALHGLQGQAEDEILGRVAQQFALREKVPEGRAAVLGGALTGALTGLKADVLSGGFTLGGGMLAGGLLGALGAAGLARGVNVWRDTGHGWVAVGDEAMAALLQAALLRYLAVAHFGRGRGDWVQGEAPPHWPHTVDQALAPQAAAWQALWAGRSKRLDNHGEAAALAAALLPLLSAAAQRALHLLYPPQEGMA